jgi:hypothetical protein
VHRHTSSTFDQAERCSGGAHSEPANVSVSILLNAWPSMSCKKRPLEAPVRAGRACDSFPAKGHKRRCGRHAFEKRISPHGHRPVHMTWIRRAFGVFLERPYQSKAVMPLEEGRQFAHNWSLARQRQDCWSLGLFQSLSGPGSS